MEKQCFKCNQTKPLTEYYKHSQMGDGHLNKCKDCTRKDTKVNSKRKLNEDPNFLDDERKRHRDKYYRLGYKEKHKPTNSKAFQNQQNYKRKFPEKYKAKTASGKLPSILDHKHHWSYNEEHYKDVIHMYAKDHLKAHRFIVYDQERMMYRTLEGLLLNTKEKHLSYIMDKVNNEED